jgi:hypothetical protein
MAIVLNGKGIGDRVFCAKESQDKRNTSFNESSVIIDEEREKRTIRLESRTEKVKQLKDSKPRKIITNPLNFSFSYKNPIQKRGLVKIDS